MSRLLVRMLGDVQTMQISVDQSFSVLSANASNRRINFQVLQNCHILPQRIILRTIAEQLKGIALTVVGHIYSGNFHLSACRLNFTGDYAKGGRFTGTSVTENSQNLAGLDGEGKTLDCDRCEGLIVGWSGSGGWWCL